MDQDGTWHGGGPWSRPHCARWGHSSPPPILTHVYCGQTAGWIKTPLGTEVDLGPGDFVLDGDPAPPQKGGGAPPQFSARVYCGQTVGDIKMPLGMEAANGLVQLFLHSLQHKVPILYNGRPYPPEVPFPTGDLDLPCNT